jgi:hypothetical protein
VALLPSARAVVNIDLAFDGTVTTVTATGSLIDPTTPDGSQISDSTSTLSADASSFSIIGGSLISAGFYTIAHSTGDLLPEGSVSFSIQPGFPDPIEVGDPSLQTSGVFTFTTINGQVFADDSLDSIAVSASVEGDLFGLQASGPLTGVYSVVGAGGSTDSIIFGTSAIPEVSGFSLVAGLLAVGSLARRRHCGMPRAAARRMLPSRPGE